MFEKEMAYFNSILDSLLENKHEGKFAVIKGKELLDTYSSFEEAYRSGIQAFERDIFLIKLIVKEEPPENIPALTLGVIDAHL